MPKYIVTKAIFLVYDNLSWAKLSENNEKNRGFLRPTGTESV